MQHGCSARKAAPRQMPQMLCPLASPDGASSCILSSPLLCSALLAPALPRCETIDIRSEGSIEDKIHAITGSNTVDAAVDCVGFEARGMGAASAGEVPAQVLNDCMTIVREGGQIGIPGLYVTEDPGAVDDNAKLGNLSMRFGLGWSKSASMHTGQCPVMQYHRPLMNAILYDKIQIAKAVNAQVISLDDAPKGYVNFDQGESVKYVIDPHGATGLAKAL